MNNHTKAAWIDFIGSWCRRYGDDPVTLAQVASLPGAQRWMQNSGTRQELGATLTNNATLHPTLHPTRLRGRYAYDTKAGRVRRPAIWRLTTADQQMAGASELAEGLPQEIRRNLPRESAATP